jgi:NTP pyrophosphatase (non-canonical NTP hydrolase)
MVDSETVISQLKTLIGDFVRERSWERFHNPKELAIALSIEANELLQLFLFKNPSKNEMMNEGSLRTSIEEEMADVLAYLLSISNSLNIDISKAFESKIKRNNLKYPTHKFNGNYEKM